MDDYISREAVIKAAKCHYPKANEMIAGIILVPAADVVARDCYDRILAENDTMREMLAGIGKKPGDKMDDVRPVVKAQRRRETEVMAAVVSGHYGGRTPYGEREEETMRDERLLLNAMQEEMGHAKEKSEEQAGDAG